MVAGDAVRDRGGDEGPDAAREPHARLRREDRVGAEGRVWAVLLGGADGHDDLRALAQVRFDRRQRAVSEKDLPVAGHYVFARCR